MKLKHIGRHEISDESWHISILENGSR